MKPVKQLKIKSKKVSELIKSMKDTGFNGKKLARACLVYEEMIKKPGCTKFFGLAGAMVPAGMRGIIRDWISKGYIDVLVTTGANMTHDVAEALGHHHLQGKSQVSDKELKKKKIDRIYDVFMKNEVYGDMEDFVQRLEINDRTSVKELLWMIGRELNDPESILTTAAKKKVPVFCPGFVDCGLAVQIALNHQRIVLDYFKDLRELINLAWDAEPAGFVLIGGGVPKNHIMQALQFTPNNASYAVQITTDTPSPGGLSGAELREGISWGKVNPEAKFVSALCDATIALPLMAAYLE
ncbi:deoxyhypusine synthase [archaeon]|nr:deoxyhypusine synthase [archaeon]